MKKETSIRIAGAAGLGILSAGMALCKIFKKAGIHLYGNSNYMSRIRGGNNFLQIRLTPEPASALREKDDVVVALDGESVKIHSDFLAQGGLLMADRNQHGGDAWRDEFVDISFADLAVAQGGNPGFANIAVVGAVAALFQLDKSLVAGCLREIFKTKPEDIIEKNLKVAEAGAECFRVVCRRAVTLPGPHEIGDTFLLNGNEAIALGAVQAGCRFYSAYPMTPATSIMGAMVRFAGKRKIVVEQAEDEIAAVNMAIGASYAGVRAMTGTSGGGFALMTEGVSLAAMTETPVVIALSQRPGPATGFPTRTEQGDLNLALYAGHGEFARAIYTPGSLEECYRLTFKAFETADRYQLPAIILTDQHLADGLRVMGKDAFPALQPQPAVIGKQEGGNITDYSRYLLTETGISPRAVPSWIKDVVIADSDEHTEKGHITENGQLRIRNVEKRLAKKMRLLEAEVEPPVMKNCETANIILIGFGSTHGVISEVSRNSNGKIGSVHLPQVWPLPVTALSALAGQRGRLITVENNAGAQLGRLLKQETNLPVSGSLLKFDGRPFNVDELLRRIEKDEVVTWT